MQYGLWIKELFWNCSSLLIEWVRTTYTIIQCLFILLTISVKKFRNLPLILSKRMSIYLLLYFWFWHFQEWHFQKCYFQIWLFGSFWHFWRKFWFWHFQEWHFRKWQFESVWVDAHSLSASLGYHKNDVFGYPL